ncbi:MAG: hypothetical protein AAF215_15435 [Cyanobacteria bacterium P01_A01_bin.123]
MSEANLPPHDPVQPQPGIYPPTYQGSLQPHTPAQAEASASDEWQSVPLPQAIQAQDLGLAPDRNGAHLSSSVSPSHAAEVTVATERETELLSLIHDLNACNDHLLQRVAQLEDALETSQTALQAEIVRSQDQPTPSLTQAAAPHPQIAQLISDLDYAQQDLKQQRVLNETLKAQLAASHQQIAQLERECALLRQRDGEQSQALSRAESNCRDLRVRLQRQQRYTLQFKVALEKSLDVAAHRSEATTYGYENVADNGSDSVVETGNSPSIVAMPKIQRIQPWSADATPIQSEPALETLIQGIGVRSKQPPAPAAADQRPDPQPQNPPSVNSQPPAVPRVEADPEAETLLWKDLERVIDAAASGVPSTSPELNRAETGSTQSEGLTQSEPQEGSVSSESEPLMIETPMPELTQSNQPEPPQFTEPSPWGAPLPAPATQQNPPEQAKTDSGGDPQPIISQPVIHQSENLPAPDALTLKQEVAAALMARAQNLQSPENATGLPPALTYQNAPSSPSPIVHPLRPQKKIKSLAAVQLPNFPRRKS